MTAFTERLVTRLAGLSNRKQASRRGFLTTATVAGAALALDPWGYLTRPQDAYAATCGSDPGCDSGYSVFCCTINHGHNTCPPHTFPGGWWKADRSSYCGGAARYYIDCNADPGHHFSCHCNKTSCDHRLVACNIFRYGQCNTHVHGITAVVCRQISCRPPWQLYPGKCGRSSATDNNTAGQTAPCLTKKNTYPKLVTFPKAPAVLHAGHALGPGRRLTAPDRHTTLLMRADGNLVVRNEHGTVWSSNTTHRARGGKALLRHTGELVILDAHGRQVWGRGPRHVTGGVRLQIYDDGQVRIVQREHVLWHTHTHTP